MIRALSSIRAIAIRTDASGAVKDSMPEARLPRPVLAFACFVALQVILLGFFTDRNGDVDELAMYNPAYMLAHYGRLAFPSYSHRTFYDEPVIIHPPLHLALIGLLGRIGFTWYYAEATPTVLLYLASIIVIVRSLFPSPVKLGLLFSIGFLMLTGETCGLTFGTRPEGALQGAWFLGLVLLEAGRLDNWNRAKLFAGAFVLTWASMMHYYAGLAFTGVAVYLVWVVRNLGWKNSKSHIVSLCAGGCLFAIPYAGLYLLPHLKLILRYISMVQGGGGVPGSVSAHLQLYRAWAHDNALPAIIRRPFGLGIPFMVFSTAVLGVIRSTRGIAMAALPLQSFVFFFASHKQPWYLLHEIALFTAAMGVGTLVLGDYLVSRGRVPILQRAFLPVASLMLFLYLATGNPMLRAAVVSTAPKVHEGDIARAAAKLILGPGARVAGRYGAWYTSGAAYWWDIESEMLGPSPYDPTRFFANFDAVVDYPHMSDVTSNLTISSSYASGILKLRGFYFGETNEQLQIVLLSARPVAQIVGYAARNGQVYRFEEHASGGDYEVLVAACSQAPGTEYWNWKQRWAGTFSTELLLPKPTSEARVLVTVLMPRPEPASWIGRFCNVIDRHTGSLEIGSKEALIDSLRHDDRPIRFPRALGQMPGYVGVGVPPALMPPKESIRINGLLTISDLKPNSSQVHVDHKPEIVVTTPQSGGAFAASIPIKHSTSLHTSCWVLLRLKVEAGQIGLAAFNNISGILTRTQAAILKSNEPQDVALPVEDLRHATQIVIFNEGDLPGQVTVLDGAILVTPEDWERNKQALSGLR